MLYLLHKLLKWQEVKIKNDCKLTILDFEGKFIKDNDNISLLSSYRVAPNIALIKYWGKYDEDLIIPLNTSISITLDSEDMFTETRVELSNKYKEDTLEINGEYLLNIFLVN